MSDREASPITQLLTTLGITREELQKRTGQMRQFLTADSTFSSRVSGTESSTSRTSSSSNMRSNSLSTASAAPSARSFSRASSSSLLDASPAPSTPVKSEPVDGTIPGRQLDSMEIIIERQRQARKDKRRRDRVAPPSPSPGASRESNGLDHARDEEGCASSSSSTRQSPPPLTPQQSKYYRAHTATQSATGLKLPTRTESPTPTRAPSAAIPANILHHYYPQYVPPPAEPSIERPPPVTPTPMRVLKHSSTRSSPLPPSSPPPPTSSPASSPVRGLINLVSSPGPMGPAPDEDDYDGLPYTLPSGPYMPTKPECSYAALLGQAILSSPTHRLTLQEIYDWITIVYPYFKRGETTWMNSIRHVLSTTVVFRKVVRERALGRTQWAIWDEDLPCFKDGGFRKHLAGDNKTNPVSIVKRARTKDDDPSDTTRKAKKPRTTKSIPPPLASTSHPIFPPIRPTPHHQSYYDSCVSQNMSTDVLFPPLPPTANYRKVSDIKAETSSLVLTPAEPANEHVPEPHSPLAHKRTITMHLASAASSSSLLSSVPSLTPSAINDSSSSPPIPTSEIEPDENSSDATKIVEPEVRVVSGRACEGFDDPFNDHEPSAYTEDVFTIPKLTPVSFWGEGHPKNGGPLQPGIQLQFADPAMLMGSDDEEDEPPVKLKAKRQKKSMDIVPPSPTLRLRSSRSTTKNAHASQSAKSRLADPTPVIMGRSTSAGSTSSPGSGRPSTPPLKPLHSSYLSPIRTPISHKGFHMSPSTSLAHYKSNLDPPPVYPYHPDEDDEHDPLKTPLKKRTLSGGMGGLPITPRRLFPLTSDSPFRTPGNSSSPFRGLYDPHDTGAMLDDELNRMTAVGHNDSPTGLFGKSKTQLLYSSPGQSPGKYGKWW